MEDAGIEKTGSPPLLRPNSNFGNKVIQEIGSPLHTTMLDS